MSQQALNLRRSVQIVRRHRKLFAAITILGLLIGAAYAVLKPPSLSSTALVVLPGQGQQAAASSTGNSGTGGSSNGESSFIATQVVIAGSDSVLSHALPHVRPAMSLQALAGRIHTANLAGNIISISAAGGTASQAEATANAVASSYIAYIGTSASPVGRVPASILESATSATGPRQPERIALFGLVGLLAGALVGFVVSLAIGRHDRRLTERDAIANSIGAPVLASVPVGHPSDAASWIKLLAEYEPGVVHAWRLRTMLQQLGVADIAAPDGGHVQRSAVPSLTVLSLASDAGALALGPQLASFAASLGIATALVIGPHQDVNAIATLRTACAASPQLAAESRQALRLIVSEDGVLRGMPADFVVVVNVVDGKNPRMPDSPRTSAMVLGVSAGAATEEQLARAATAAAAGGREISGILVADPEPDDQTTGRVPRLAPPRRRLPTRLKDVPMEIKR